MARGYAMDQDGCGAGAPDSTDLLAFGDDRDAARDVAADAVREVAADAGGEVTDELLDVDVPAGLDDLWTVDDFDALEAALRELD